MLDYLSYKEAIANSQATQEEMDELASEVKKGWWEKNKNHIPGLLDAETSSCRRIIVLDPNMIYRLLSLLYIWMDYYGLEI